MIPQKVFVKQEVKPLKAIFGFNPKNSYLVFDEDKNKLFYAYEKSNSFMRLFFRPLRALTLRVVYYDNSSINNSNGNDVFENVLLEIKRKFTLGFSKFFIYKNGALISIVQTKSDFFLHFFYVLDRDENLLFFTKTINTPFLTCKIFPNEEEFKKNYKNEGSELASISMENKTFKNLFDSEGFFVDFKNLDEEKREIVLALVFIIDILSFRR